MDELWRSAEAVTWCVGVAVVLRRFLAPWTLWLARRAACRCRRYYRRYYRRAAEAATWTPTCPCCDGVDFDGMAGRWAVVTGCTDGIGKEYALQVTLLHDTSDKIFSDDVDELNTLIISVGLTTELAIIRMVELADRRINVVLVSRNLDKLRAVAREIHKRHATAVQTRVVAADFTSSCGSVSLGDAYDAVRRGLAGLRDVALLINNAGVSYARPERLLDLPPCCSGTATAAGTAGDPCRDVVECNVLAAVAMCRIVMPLMMRNADDKDSDDSQTYGNDSKTYGNDSQTYGNDLKTYGNDSKTYGNDSSSSRARGGVVINMSSASARLPSPLLAVYAATKAFLEKFSEELAVEYGGEMDGESRPKTPRIAVRCLTPGFVATKMTRIRAGTTGRVGWTSVPGPEDYARQSLRSLSCRCGCNGTRQVDRQDNHRNYGSTATTTTTTTTTTTAAATRGDDERTNGTDDTAGWLADAIAAAFDSPSSPFSAGRSGVTTAGYTTHTLMIIAVNLARWTVGDAYVSNAVGRMMSRNRDRMACREAKHAAKKAVPLTSRS